ncbi:MAG TPA: hypothetical protein VGR02_12370 [Thermoanaerobaculia bacterium]|nr:hypothetical protein [Thermoanaerobaculia bacterium]
MRKVLILLLLALPAAAVTLGPAVPLTPAANNGTHTLPVLALTTSGGTAAIWRAEATHAGAASGNLTTVATDNVPDPTPYRDATIASIGDESYPVWVENDWIYGFVLAGNGQPRTQPKLLSMVDSRHTQRLAVGAGGNRYLMVWGVWTKMLAIVLDQDGNVLVGDTALIPGGNPTRGIDEIAIASNGNEFLVVWEETGDVPWDTPCGVICPSGDRTVHAITVGLDGQPRPETEIELATNAGMPDVVWNGSDYLVVWSRMPDGGVSGRHVAAGGGAAGEVVNFTTGADFGPDLVWDGAAYDLAFVRNQTNGLFAIRTNGDGSSISPLFDGPVGHVTSARGYSFASQGKSIALAYENDGRIFVRRASTDSTPGRIRAIRH